MAHCGCRYKGQGTHARRGAPDTDNAPPPWPRGERGSGGRLSTCSAAPCHRSPLEPFRKPAVRLLPDHRAGLGNGPDQDAIVLELHRPVLQEEVAKTSPKMASQRLVELSTVSEGCTCVWFSVIMTPRFPPHRVPVSKGGIEGEGARHGEGEGRPHQASDGPHGGDPGPGSGGKDRGVSPNAVQRAHDGPGSARSFKAAACRLARARQPGTCFR
jgi:hypothetical protein